MNSLYRCTLIALLAGFVAACHQVPITGRRAVSLVDDKEVTKMSIGMFDDMKKRHRLSRDRDRIAQLQRIGDRLSKVVFWDMPDAEWEFVVFEANQINAFAMAGGKVGVFSGLFKIARTDDEIASVIAHEIAHVTAKHIHEKLSQEMAVNTVGMVGSIGMSAAGMPVLTAIALEQAYGIGTGVGALAFDRAKEKEADKMGLIYMARAGYDPQAAITVMERLEAESASDPVQPAILSTHPTHPERIIELMNAMPEAQKEREMSAVTTGLTIIK